jgi:hypothetical protein
VPGFPKSVAQHQVKTMIMRMVPCNVQGVTCSILSKLITHCGHVRSGIEAVVLKQVDVAYVVQGFHISTVTSSVRDACLRSSHKHMHNTSESQRKNCRTYPPSAGSPPYPWSSSFSNSVLSCRLALPTAGRPRSTCSALKSCSANLGSTNPNLLHGVPSTESTMT